MFAIVRTGGKQYRVQKGDKIYVEKLEGKDGEALSLSEVLFVGDDKTAKCGTPLLAGAEVKAKIVEQARAEKITIFKKKRRQNYRRKKGHRQNLTKLEITDIKAA